MPNIRHARVGRTTVYTGRIQDAGKLQRLAGVNLVGFLEKYSGGTIQGTLRNFNRVQSLDIPEIVSKIHKTGGDIAKGIMGRIMGNDLSIYTETKTGGAVDMSKEAVEEQNKFSGGQVGISEEQLDTFRTEEISDKIYHSDIWMDKRNTMVECLNPGALSTALNIEFYISLESRKFFPRLSFVTFTGVFTVLVKGFKSATLPEYTTIMNQGQQKELNFGQWRHLGLKIVDLDETKTTDVGGVHSFCPTRTGLVNPTTNATDAFPNTKFALSPLESFCLEPFWSVKMMHETQFKIGTNVTGKLLHPIGPQMDMIHNYEMPEDPDVSMFNNSRRQATNGIPTAAEMKRRNTDVDPLTGRFTTIVKIPDFQREWAYNANPVSGSNLTLTMRREGNFDMYNALVVKTDRIFYSYRPDQDVALFEEDNNVLVLDADYDKFDPQNGTTYGTSHDRVESIADKAKDIEITKLQDSIKELKIRTGLAPAPEVEDEEEEEEEMEIPTTASSGDKRSSSYPSSSVIGGKKARVIGGPTTYAQTHWNWYATSKVFCTINTARLFARIGTLKSGPDLAERGSHLEVFPTPEYRIDTPTRSWNGISTLSMSKAEARFEAYVDLVVVAFTVAGQGENFFAPKEYLDLGHRSLQMSIQGYNTPSERQEFNWETMENVKLHWALDEVNLLQTSYGKEGFNKDSGFLNTMYNYLMKSFDMGFRNATMTSSTDTSFTIRVEADGANSRFTGQDETLAPGAFKDRNGHQWSEWLSRDGTKTMAQGAQGINNNNDLSVNMLVMSKQIKYVVFLMTETGSHWNIFNSAALAHSQAAQIVQGVEAAAVTGGDVTPQMPH